MGKFCKMVKTTNKIKKAVHEDADDSDDNMIENLVDKSIGGLMSSKAPSGMKSISSLHNSILSSGKITSSIANGNNSNSGGIGFIYGSFFFFVNMLKLMWQLTRWKLLKQQVHYTTVEA